MDAEIEERAMRLREAVLGKNEAINNHDFHGAADMRGKEYALYELNHTGLFPAAGNHQARQSTQTGQHQSGGFGRRINAECG